MFLLYLFFGTYFSATSIMALLMEFVSSIRDLIFLHTIPLLLFTTSILDNIVDVSLSREAVYNAFICWSLKRSHSIYSFDIDFEFCSHWFLFNAGITSYVDR